MPVRIVKPADGSLPSATPLTKHNVVIEAHRFCQPVKIDPKRGLIEVTLPDRVAQMYLDMIGEWKLPSLTGVSTAPLLSADGGIRAADGYDIQAYGAAAFQSCGCQNAHRAPTRIRHCGCYARRFIVFRLPMRHGVGIPLSGSM
jgi:hypothetical protein